MGYVSRYCEKLTVDFILCVLTQDLCWESVSKASKLGKIKKKKKAHSNTPL